MVQGCKKGNATSSHIRSLLQLKDKLQIQKKTTSKINQGPHFLEAIFSIEPVQKLHFNLGTKDSA